MNKSLITEPLGLFGWTHLEPVILAALATESPMLLIGKHGAAKSFLLERLAEALNLEFRCYNASLINYDDLVGIPIPVNNNTSLDYISNPNSIWNAEVLFVDEINRTKPELQNKLFPIIYDKRVQGQKLEKLRYRWSAMNPPSNNDEDEEDELNYYGASPLDPALADRFPFLVEVPSWDELSDEDRKKMLFDAHEGRHEFPVNIHSLIEQTKTHIQEVLTNEKEKAVEYIVFLMSVASESLGYISARRATMLLKTLVAIIAANRTLQDYGCKEESFSDDVCIHIQNTIPNVANKHIDKTVLVNIALQALKIANLEDDIERSIFRIKDPVEKVKFAINHSNKLEASLICDVITTSVASIPNPFRRALALVCYLSFRKRSDIYAAVMETLLSEIRPVLNLKSSKQLCQLSKRKIADKVVEALHGIDRRTKYFSYINNLLYSFLPDGYNSEEEPSKLLAFLIRTMKDVELL